jgi:hypothetical protein
MVRGKGRFLVTLGKRMLGFSASSSGCCAGPAAAERANGSEATGSEAKAVEMKTAEAHAPSA